MSAESDPAVSVRFWGVRGSIPSPGPETTHYGANTSCLELRADHQILILDAGCGLRPLGLKLEEEFGANGFEATLLITHTHWDHIQGLPFCASAYRDSNRIRILTPPGRRAQILAALENQMQPMHFPVRFGALSAITALEELPAAGKSIGHVRIAATDLNHPEGCGGYRLDVDGVSVAFLPDHEPYHSSTLRDAASAGAKAAEKRLAAFIHRCDLLILDTQYDEAEYPMRRGWGHGCVADSVALAIAGEVRELVLFHHDPSHSDAKLAQILARAEELIREAGSSLLVRAAREGDEICLSPAPPSGTAGPVALSCS